MKPYLTTEQELFLKLKFDLEIRTNTVTIVKEPGILEFLKEAGYFMHWPNERIWIYCVLPDKSEYITETSLEVLIEHLIKDLLRYSGLTI